MFKPERKIRFLPGHAPEFGAVDILTAQELVDKIITAAEPHQKIYICTQELNNDFMSLVNITFLLEAMIEDIPKIKSNEEWNDNVEFVNEYMNLIEIIPEKHQAIIACCQEAVTELTKSKRKRELIFASIQELEALLLTAQKILDTLSAESPEWKRLFTEFTVNMKNYPRT